MAVIPLSATNISILSGIPFNIDYKNTRWFNTELEQRTWFQNRNVLYSQSDNKFQRIEGRYFMKADMNIDSLLNANYLMFQNTEYGNKWFYAFVTQVEFLNPKTTKVYFELDVLQTWRFEMNFKPSFVVREHRPLWNSDGTPVLNTIDEQLNYGTVYETVDVLHYKPYRFYFLVVAMKEKRHFTDGEQDKKINPTYNGIPQPLTFYVHPFIDRNISPTMKIDGIEPVNKSNVMEVIEGLSTQEDAVNNVVSAYITDNIGINFDYDEHNNELTIPSGNFEYATFSDDVNMNFTTLALKTKRNYNTLEKNLGNKYEGYDSVSESKLLMYPYTVLILDDFRGNRIELKNEYIDGKDIIVTSMGSLGTSNKVSYGIKNYQTDKLNESGVDRMLMEHSIINNDPQDIPVINDFLSAYLQGNRNSINTQRNSAIFNGITSIMGAGIGASASAGIGSLKDNAKANPIGIASSGVSAIQGAGNAVLQLQAIESKIKDIDNTPPQMSRMGSNPFFEYGNQYDGVYVIKKQIHPEYRKLLTDFFKMYGYKTNEVKIPNFRTRKNWNYVQTLNCNILGNFNNEDMQELKNVFDNGITLWHTDDIGNYNLGNEVR